MLILALLGATGSHWIVMQSVAWATMLAGNAKVESFHVALEKTFDGKHPCSLCKQIAKGKQSERKAEFQTEIKKLEFFDNTVSFVIYSPQAFSLLPERAEASLLRANAPPVPPPRSLLG
ncbi:hypothetical protein [Pedosphaera parvula]|uniref:Uncharacterized protein n=1 Tax=Pedosphaera parvula (strain Ellin514) TaxID=320771 RepID=B9X9S0_PEDPL|nr:hypothetical protein [Pedosphaera parvula]EEF63288.1 conserved hypothetical protein [Pedosphaera parvula Ellin514]